jgi:iron complex outermembrane receptor protein
VDPARCPTTAAARDCTLGFPARAGGNPDIQSESSSQWGFGGVWSPSPFVTIGADFFQVVVDDLISGLTSQQILAGCPDGVNGGTCRMIVRGAQQAEYPQLPGPIQLIRVSLFNLGTIRTQGIDVAAQLKSPKSAWGSFGLSMQGTYILKYLQQQLDGSYLSMLNKENNQGPSGAIPYWHHYLTLDWNYGPWAATLTENFVKGVWDASPDVTTGQPRRVGNYDIWNLSGSWSGLAGWQFSLGVKNLFDRDPPFTNQSWTAANGAPAGYDPTYTNPIGRVFWGAIAYRFK